MEESLRKGAETCKMSRSGGCEGGGHLALSSSIPPPSVHKQKSTFLYLDRRRATLFPTHRTFCSGSAVSFTRPTNHLYYPHVISAFSCRRRSSVLWRTSPADVPASNLSVQAHGSATISGRLNLQSPSDSTYRALPGVCSRLHSIVPICHLLCNHTETPQGGRLLFSLICWLA